MSTLSTIWRYAKIGIGGTLTLFGAIAILGPGSSVLERMAALETEGELITGKVTDKTTESRSVSALEGKFGFSRGVAAGQRLAKGLEGDASDHLTKTTYQIEYEYKAPKAEPIKKTATVTGAQYDALAVGADLEILFHPADPHVHRATTISEPFQTSAPGGGLIVGLTVIGFGLFLLFRNLRFADDAAPARGNANASQRVQRATASRGAVRTIGASGTRPSTRRL